MTLPPKRRSHRAKVKFLWWILVALFNKMSPHKNTPFVQLTFDSLTAVDLRGAIVKSHPIFETEGFDMRYL